MRIYLCGQRSFGAEALQTVRALGHEIVGVSAPRETRDGRPDRLWRAATTLNLPLLAAGELNAGTLPPGVDLIVCAHSHDFIGRRTREATTLGAIGYHPSLLPLHRGRDAVAWAVRMREQVTGGTIYWLNDTVDGGPIAAQEFCLVRRDDTPGELWRRALLPMGLLLLRCALQDIAGGTLVRIPQDEALATWEPALGAQPLVRPDLPQLTDGRLSAYRVVTGREYDGAGEPVFPDAGIVTPWDQDKADAAADLRLAINGVG